MTVKHGQKWGGETHDEAAAQRCQRPGPKGALEMVRSGQILDVSRK